MEAQKRLVESSWWWWTIRCRLEGGQWETSTDSTVASMGRAQISLSPPLFCLCCCLRTMPLAISFLMATIARLPLDRWCGAPSSETLLEWLTIASSSQAASPGPNHFLLPDKLDVAAAIRILALLVRLELGLHIVRVDAHFKVVLIAARRAIAGSVNPPRIDMEKKKKREKKKHFNLQRVVIHCSCCSFGGWIVTKSRFFNETTCSPPFPPKLFFCLLLLLSARLSQLKPDKIQWQRAHERRGGKEKGWARRGSPTGANRRHIVPRLLYNNNSTEPNQPPRPYMARGGAASRLETEGRKRKEEGESSVCVFYSEAILLSTGRSDWCWWRARPWTCYDGGGGWEWVRVGG